MESDVTGKETERAALQGREERKEEERSEVMRRGERNESEGERRGRRDFNEKDRRVELEGRGGETRSLARKRKRRYSVKEDEVETGRKRKKSGRFERKKG